MKSKIKLSSVKQQIIDLYKNNKKMFFASIICVVIIIFLCISSIQTVRKKGTTLKQEQNIVSVTEFAENVEKKITSIVSKIDSVKSVSAFVMVEATPKIEYLTEKKETTITNADGSKTEITTTVVFEKNGSSTKPVIITTIMPKITGVLIITNKINSSTKLSIINSISIVLNIDESCISILQGN